MYIKVCVVNTLSSTGDWRVQCLDNQLLETVVVLLIPLSLPVQIKPLMRRTSSGERERESSPLEPPPSPEQKLSNN